MPLDRLVRVGNALVLVAQLPGVLGAALTPWALRRAGGRVRAVRAFVASLAAVFAAWAGLIYLPAPGGTGAHGLLPMFLMVGASGLGVGAGQTALYILPVVILQRTVLDSAPCFSQPRPGFSFPVIAFAIP